jgi:hypothetical protein
MQYMTEESLDKKTPDRQFQIAAAFITGFFIFVGLALGQLIVTGNGESIKLIGALFGGWVGTIIGFYFGQKPVEQVRKELNKERKRTEELTDYIRNRSEEMWKKLEEKDEKAK